jgi:hypothetical protein
MDCGLDIVADADLRWRWKDEEDFEILQQMGWIGPDDARRLRQEGLRVIERIESRRAPFDEPWAAWCPEPTWPMPELPADWDRVPEGIDCT